MTPPARTRSRTQIARLEARVTPEQKTFFQRAANLRGVTLKEFMIASMHEAAVKTIGKHELVFSANEQQTLVNMLMNPPKPNAALRAASQTTWRRSPVRGAGRAFKILHQRTARGKFDSGPIRRALKRQRNFTV